MLRKTAFTLFFLLMICTTLSAQTIPDDWFIYMYDNDTNVLTRVHADMQTVGFDLDLPTEQIDWLGMTFSDDGRLLAYCHNNFGVNSDQRDYTLVLRDIEAETDVLVEALPGVFNCVITSQAFSTDGSLFAISVNSVSFAQSATPDRPAWQILIFDTATGELVNELNHQSPIVIDLQNNVPNDALGLSIMPTIQAFNAESIVFDSWFWLTEIVPLNVAFSWYYSENQLEILPYASNPSYDLFETTGEILWLAADSRVPLIEPVNPYASPYNAVFVLQTDGTEKAVLYSTDYNLIEARFSEDGSQIIVTGTTPVDSTVSPVTGGDRVRLTLSRDGNIAQLDDSSVLSAQTLASELANASGVSGQLLWWQELSNTPSNELQPFIEAELPLQ